MFDGEHVSTPPADVRPSTLNAVVDDAGPISTSIFSLLRRRSTVTPATDGSSPSSPPTSVSASPFTPPAALMSRTAISMPLIIGGPTLADWPDTGRR